ncbi:MAG: hypothetical protein WBB24_06330 [Maribacter sp.]
MSIAKQSVSSESGWNGLLGFAYNKISDFEQKPKANSQQPKV